MDQRLQSDRERTRIGSGFWFGAVLSLPVVVLSQLADRLLGLGFIPFDIFEWLTRHLPGRVVTAGIDLMVEIITGFGIRPTATAAKVAEQTLALALFVVGSGVLGALVALLHRMSLRAGVAGVLASGAWVALALLGQAQGGAGGSLWRVALLVAWGAALGATVGLADPSAGDSREALGARRRFMALFAGGVASLVALALGLSAFWRRRTAAAPSDEEEIVAAIGTSGPAASPPPEVLAARPAPAPGTRPEITANKDFYRIDITLKPPRIDAAAWKLTVDGKVNAPLTLSLDELRGLPAVTQVITLECISNTLGGDLISTGGWTGVRLRDVLRLARAREGWKALRIDSADGYYESVVPSDAEDERTLLVYEMNGVPLPVEHGFPLRIYIPNRHGMKQPKSIERIRVSDEDVPGYWVERGWNRDAVPKTTSVIDAVGTSMMLGSAATLPVGGIAYAGARGISAVEVQVDEGPWTRATLIAPPLSTLAWTLWRYDWPYQPGHHVVRVRAYDGTGALQPTESRGPHPDGASGIHSVSIDV